MFRKISGKTFGLAASLVLAGGAICATAASAQHTAELGGCSEQISSMCNSNWQSWGYMGYWDCYQGESCYACPDSNSNCTAISWLDNGDVNRHDSHGH